MNNKHLFKKSISLWIVFLLFLSLNNIFILPVASDPHKVDDDGLWYDDFTIFSNINQAIENNSIRSYEDVVIDEGKIKLDEGERTVTYDHSETPKKIQAWHMSETLVHPSSGTLLGEVSKLLNPDSMLGDEFSNSDYDGTKDKNDGEYAETDGLVDPRLNRQTYYPIQQYRITVGENVGTIKDITFNWKYGDFYADANIDKINMFVWRYDYNYFQSWSKIISVDYDDTQINTGDFDLTINGFVPVSEEGHVDLLIIATPAEDGKKCTLRTDYLGCDVQIKKGFYETGYITSQLIEPTSINGWETLIWEGSEPTSETNVKVQILNKVGDVIEELEGNEEGFSDFRVDISSLPASYNQITLKAILNTDNFEVTPHFSSWTILWQSQEGFNDSFTSEYRISETYGCYVDSGNIVIDDYLTDWTMHGKDPQNTRSYITNKNPVFSEEIHWYTSDQLSIGGGLKSPVVHNGIVYIASDDGCIYAFNETANNVGDVQEAIDKSSSGYVVDSSLAISDDMLIFGTSEVASNTNHIYALNADNLSEVKWQYPNSDNTGYLSFSAAPVIANGRVYVTSWKGQYADKPVIFNLYNKINEMLGYILGTPGQLHVLDLETGSLIWDKPLNLQEASYSSPAVYEDMVIVGCEKLSGKSLVAYDIQTKEQLWNASIGYIGRCSPVVHDDKVFVMSRKQDSIASVKGTDSVYAFSTDGKMLWNKTIGENTTLLANALKFKNLDTMIITSSPISSPTVSGDTVIALNPAGELYALDTESGYTKWTMNIAYNLFEDVLPTYHSASPLVVDEVVYVISESGELLALDVSDGTVLYNYSLEFPDYSSPIPYYVYASPVVSDNLIFISMIEGLLPAYRLNRLYCVGEYTKNKYAQIISTPIHVPIENWWDVFDTDKINTTENLITFSILDSNLEEISGFTDINGEKINISGLTDNEIYLSAIFHVNNDTIPNPILKSWGISLSPETKGPIFDNQSFEPGNMGWVSGDLEQCSIEVTDQDDEGVLSGIDTSSAKFKLSYILEGSTSTKTNWFDAECTGENGVKRTTVVADIAGLDLDIKTLVNITFTIKDLAGNSATSTTVTFKSGDDQKPSSEISSPANFELTYNELIPIEADATDPGTASVDQSGVRYVYLKYQNSTDQTEWSEWTDYGESSSPFNWYFGLKTDGSNDPMTTQYYKLLTIAEDNAGNIEDLSNSKKNDAEIFLFDMTEPEITNDFGTHKNKSIPTITIEVIDDFKLQSLEYKVDFQSEWTKVVDDIDEETLSYTWTLPEDIWTSFEEEAEHKIYFRATDHAGNTYTTTSQNTFIVTKDENASAIYLDVSAFKDVQWDDEFTINLEIPDDINPAKVTLRYRYTKDDKDWNDTEWKQFGDNITASPFSWKFIAEEGDGYYQFDATIIDVSGLTYTTAIEEVQVKVVPKTQSLLFFVLVIILIIISLIVLMKMKKKQKME